MIRFLRVRNLAIVERLEVELQEGLTVLTGETGAGKSIVRARAPGGRATGGLIRDGADRAIVEAAIETDDGREIVLRRGRWRASHPAASCRGSCSGSKTLATTDLPGKTLVFDEVDAGIGGAAADRVGRMLQVLAERFQVLCVTHLPQIAACAATHQHVSKTVRDGRTTTSLERLGEQSRVTELARLMSGRATREAQEGARAAGRQPLIFKLQRTSRPAASSISSRSHV